MLDVLRVGILPLSYTQGSVIKKEGGMGIVRCTDAPLWAFECEVKL